jgi:Spy/CpxP family protein refolding chaperone
MNPRNLFLIGAVSALIPISSAMALPTTLSAPIIAQAPPSQPLGEEFPGDDVPPPPRGGREGNGEPPWAKEINLSNEQKEKIKKLHEQAKKDTESLRSQLMAEDKQMRSLFASDASSEQLRKQHQKIQGLRQQLDNKRFEVMLAERQILTAQQRSQLGKLMQQRQGRKPQGQQR